MLPIKSSVSFPFLPVLFTLFILVALPQTSSGEEATSKQEPTQEVKEQKNYYTEAEITIKIIPSAKNTFGYDILLNGGTLVHQPNIPGLPGNEGFSTKDKAKMVAEFVVKRIRNNEMPPAVTINDLRNMGVLNNDY